MSREFKLKVITPSGIVIDQEVVYIEIRTAEGSIGILANHEPLLAQLVDGDITYRTGDSDELKTLAVQDAYFSFFNNKAEVLSALN